MTLTSTNPTSRVNASFFRQVLIVALIAAAFPLCARGAIPEHQAKQALEQSTIKGGFIVSLGVSDGKLLNQLACGDKFLVHGLDTDAKAVEHARQQLLLSGAYGPVSAHQHQLISTLPYADNLVDIVFVQDPTIIADNRTLIEELTRILCRRGEVYIPISKAVSSPLSQDEWTSHWGKAEFTSMPSLLKITLPWPDVMDEWTHKQHNAGRDMVSQDNIEPLYGLRWVCGPQVPLAVDRNEGMEGMLAGNGRIFCIMNLVTDTLAVPHSKREDHDTFFLVARNAHNGLFLWKKRTTPRWSMLLVGERIFGYFDGAFQSLDAATGAVVNTYAEAPRHGFGNDVLYEGGILLVCGGGTMKALDVNTDTFIWEYSPSYGGAIIDNDIVVCLHEDELKGLALSTGKAIWTRTVRPGQKVRSCKNGILILEDTATRPIERGGHDKTIDVLRIEDGTPLWSKTIQPSISKGGRAPIFYAGGLMWICQGYNNVKVGRYWHPENDEWIGVDPRTGEKVRSFRTRWDKRGCNYLRIATDTYMVPQRPPEFFSWATGKLTFPFEGARFSCGSGGVIANGLLYTLPHHCVCTPFVMEGFLGLSPRIKPVSEFYPDNADTGKRITVDNPDVWNNANALTSFSKAEVREDGSPRLEKGPAFGAGAGGPDNKPAWPMFRANPQRTATISERVEPDVNTLWQTPVIKPYEANNRTEDWYLHEQGGDLLTGSTVWGDMIYTAMPDTHQLIAQDSSSGTIKWRFFVGSRLNTPPSLHKGLCIFGCHDGYVYCLRARDGQLVWRFLAAPTEMKILSHGQIESTWPVKSSVLIDHDQAYVVAGRTSSVDGGLYLYAIDPVTGSVKWCVQPRAARSHTLVSKGSSIAMYGCYGRRKLGYLKFDPMTSSRTIENELPTIPAMDGVFMDRRWHHGMRSSHNYDPSHYDGQLVTTDGQHAYYYRNMTKARLFDDKSSIACLKPERHASTSEWKLEFRETEQVHAMIQTGDVLWAGGPDNWQEPEKEGFLVAISAKDGRRLKTIALPASPVSDGLAAGNGKLFVSNARWQDFVLRQVGLSER